MSCGTNGVTGKQLKFIDNKLAIIFGSSTIAGVSFCKFLEDVNEYKYGELKLIPEESIELIDVAQDAGYKTIILKFTYLPTVDIDSSFILCKTNQWSFEDPENPESVVPENYNAAHEFLILNGNTIYGINFLQLLNKMSSAITIEYLFTK